MFGINILDKIFIFSIFNNECFKRLKLKLVKNLLRNVKVRWKLIEKNK